jgi:transposase InsO family protein
MRLPTASCAETGEKGICPMQNGYIERFNRTYREEVLNCYIFETLAEVRRMSGLADSLQRAQTARVARQSHTERILNGKINLISTLKWS